MATFLRRLFNQKKNFRIAQIEDDASGYSEGVRLGIVKRLSYERGTSRYSFINFNAEGSNVLMQQKLHDAMSLSVDLIYSVGLEATLQTKKALEEYQRDITHVFSVANNPVELGIVSSLDRRDKPITGVSCKDYDYDEHINKLIAIKPDLTKAMVIFDPRYHTQHGASPLQDMKECLLEKNIAVSTVEVFNKVDIAHAFMARAGERPDVCITLHDHTAMAGMNDLIVCANEAKIPIYANDLESVSAGAALGRGEAACFQGIHCADLIIAILDRGYAPQDVPIVLRQQDIQFRANTIAMAAQGMGEYIKNLPHMAETVQES